MEQQGELVGVISDLRDYLQQHPGSCDTLQGLIDWWFIRSRYLRGSQLVRQALAVLESEGWVRRQPQPGGHDLFIATPPVAGTEQQGAKDELARE
ncbi:MAG: hypothetical protein II007_07860 [Gammaproteobacteria bacterium]|nr:hypothetical protein [Gammaproteobacteria bacterium]